MTPSGAVGTPHLLTLVLTPRKCWPGVSLPVDDQLVLLGTWEERQLAWIVGNDSGSGAGTTSPDFFQDQGHLGEYKGGCEV